MLNMGNKSYKAKRTLYTENRLKWVMSFLMNLSLSRKLAFTPCIAHKPESLFPISLLVLFGTFTAVTRIKV